ncbi:hypothetical protein [Streptomyces africanus]|uniref:hypothetical protein n=1 Tax=Streptomyces africanus TaxID=231024 RepID=UPI000A3BE0E2|nr:hypothetical protein [Streptomyces africanus]
MSAIPTGPLDREPIDYPNGEFPSAAERESVLRDALSAAGVETGAYDDRIVKWLAGWEWSTLATIASWVQRAGQGGGQQSQPERAEQERTAEVLGEALEAYFQEVDPEEADTDDMAWTLVRALGRTDR